MKLLMKPVEMIIWFTKDGIPNPIKYRISENKENITVNIDKVILRQEEKLADYAFKKDEEIYPTDMAPIIISNEGIKDVRLFKWGFPGYKSSPVIINARAETVLEKPMFKDSFINRRCLIPANAFFEWKKEEKKKQKYVIHSSEINLFYMAGLYKNFVDKDGKGYTCFTIITTTAGDSMSSIHNRMPVIFNKENEIDLWLDTKDIEISKLKELLNPSEDIVIEAV